MLKKRSGFIFIFSLFFLCLLFSEETGTAGDEILSLQQIDILIESTAYNEALKELTKYINAYPNDFDRAHKRVMKVFKAREKYNKDGEELVELIRDGDDTKVDKLYKITELESSELDSTETVVDFTNLARRTVTLGEVLIHYNRIMKEGVALVKKEKFPEAALKFEEGFAIKNEFSDIVFDPKDLKNSEGIPVVYENDITDPVKKSIGTILSLVAGSLLSAGFSSRESDCEKAYNEFIKAVSAKNVDIDEVQKSFKRVNTAFSKLAELHNKIIDEAEKLQQVVELAEQRNPLLLGTSYISFQLKFVAGDSSHPDTGVIGAIEAYYNKRIESMKEKTGAIVFSILNETIKKLPEEKIYSLADKIDPERNSMKLSRDFAQTAISLHDLYKLEKTLDAVSFGEKYPDYEKSMKFVYEYISGLSLAYESVKDLAYERKNPEKINTSFVSQKLLSENLQKLLRYEKIKSDSRSYLKLIDDEKKRESEYFANLEKREREIAELVELSGGTLKISTLKKRETAGTRISDSPLDFRNQIDYFTSISRQNLDESSAHALGLWEYMSRGYMTLSRDSFDDFSKQCSDTEILLYGAGSQDDEDNFDFQESVFSEFVKHYPVEARENAEKLNSRISAKREEFLSQLEFLYKGKDDYWNVSENYKNSTLEFERIIKNFDTLYARNNVVIDKASVQIRQYEAVLADANEQFNRASDLYKKGDYKNAMLAVDAASEKYAGALEIEYSEKIRSVREVSLTELAMKIQRAEFERVLRSVFALKDRASTFYYSGNFDNAENVLLSAQLQWATVSSEPDPEIENLLAIVKNI
ncbi:hypothetical protein, partial [Treponema sp.]|uniref:hypothetical protein n=1 Tax=Treponema sp. TaxID=166 RepID=UPI00388D1970